MNPRPLFVAATASYVANCALGASVGTGLIDSSNFRWVHHGIYIATSVLAGAAASSLIWHRGDNAAAIALLPAAIPLVVIPRIRARSRRHVAIALSAAPFFLAGLILSSRK